MEGSALLEAIAAAPDDDAPRLVYADYLLQQGEPQGELIGLQVRLARADADDVLLPERTRVEARIRALLKAHAGDWSAPLVAIAAAVYTFRRGFVEHVAEYADRNFGFVAAQLFAVAPLLRAARVKPGALHSVIMNEASAEFEELAFEDPSLDVQMLARLEERLAGGALRSLDIDTPYMGGRDAVQRLAAWPSALEHFGLSAKAHKGERLTAAFLTRFAEAPHRERLRSLRFDRVDLERVETPPMLLGVETLELVDCRLARQHGNLSRIVRALPALSSLTVAKERLDSGELAEVVDACPRMRRARLRHLHLTSIDVLLPWAPTLRRLDLMGNPLGDAAAIAIIGADWPHLVELRLPMKGMTAAIQQALRLRFGDVLQ